MEAGMDSGALSESIVFLEHFTGLEDPRQPGKVVYALNEVLLLCLLAVLAGAETFTDIALFGEKKLHCRAELLRMTALAKYSRCLMRRHSSAALFPGSRR